jgi:hypothetical protein
MWTYSWQIRIRWIAFIAGGILLGAISHHAFFSYPELAENWGLKAFFANISVSAEFLPFYSWPFILLGFSFLLFLGIPTIFVFAFLSIVAGPIVGFILAFLCQLFATYSFMVYARKKFLTDQIPGKLDSLLLISDCSALSFSFWSRIYISYPNRTLDLISLRLLDEEEPTISLFIPTACALLLRMLIPSIWLISFIKIIQRISPNPMKDASDFLLYSSALVISVVLTKIPELQPCPEQVKSFLKRMENPITQKDIDDKKDYKAGIEELTRANELKNAEQATK